MKGEVPNYLAYNYISGLDDDSVLVFWCDRINDNYETKVSKYMVSDNEWKGLE